MGATGYEIYRSTALNGIYSLIGTTVSANYINSGLVVNSTYYYKVRTYSINNGINTYGQYSNIVSAKPILSKPILYSVSSGYNSNYISWIKVYGASGYQLYRSTSPNGTYVLLGDTTRNYTTNRYLIIGRTYYYKARSYRTVNGIRVYSEFSNISSATPTLNTPINLNVKRYTITSVRVSWNRVSGAYAYEIYRLNPMNGTYQLIRSTMSSSYINSGLTKGNSYSYKVRAYRIIGGKRVYGAFTNTISTILPI